MIKLEDYIVMTQVNDLEEIIFNDQIDEGKIKDSLKKIWNFITGKRKNKSKVSTNSNSTSSSPDENENNEKETKIEDISWNEIQQSITFNDKLKRAKDRASNSSKVKMKGVKDNGEIVALMVYMERSDIEGYLNCPYILALQVNNEYTGKGYLRNFVTYIYNIAQNNGQQYILVSDAEYKTKEYWKKAKFDGEIEDPKDKDKCKAHYGTRGNIVKYINEELDDNLYWLLDKWFEMNDVQLSEFIGICVQCKNDRVPSTENIKKYLNGTHLGNQLHQFIDFVSNDIVADETRNDIDIFKTIIKTIISKKENNKYLY